jgi:hypothetical protein
MYTASGVIEKEIGIGLGLLVKTSGSNGQVTLISIRVQFPALSQLG